jgi:hypothetical protein
MAVNPAGFVPVYGTTNPEIISGRAREALSGGQFVFISGAADVVSSGLNSFNPKTDILFAAGGSNTLFSGIVTQNVASGGIASVQMNGVVNVRAYGTVTAGTTVVCEGTDAVASATTAGAIIGRALSSAASGNFALIRLGGL